MDFHALIEEMAGELVLLEKLDIPNLMRIMALLDQLGASPVKAEVGSFKTLLLDISLGLRGGEAESRVCINDAFSRLKTAWLEVPGENPKVPAAGAEPEPVRVETPAPLAAEAPPVAPESSPFVLEFVAESREHLDGVETEIIEWEAYPEDQEAVNAIFRAFHTIKGGAGYLGYPAIQSTATDLENLLSACRDGHLHFSGALADLILAGVDILQQMMAWVENCVRSGPVPPPETEAAGLAEKIRLVIEAGRSGAVDRLGALLVRDKAADPSAVRGALRLQSGGDERRLGEILVDQSNVDSSRVAEMLRRQAEAAEVDQTAFRIEMDAHGLDEFRAGALSLVDEMESFLCDVEEGTENDIAGKTFLAMKALRTMGLMCGNEVLADFVNRVVSVYDQVRQGCLGMQQKLVEATLGACDVIRTMLEFQGLPGEAEPEARAKLETIFQEFLPTVEAEAAEAIDLDLGEPPPPRKSARDRTLESDAASTLRVPAKRLDRLVDLVGELVTVHARLSQTAALRGDAQFLAIAEELERLTGNLRDNTMSIRMLPIGTLFGRFKRLVRDLARDLGKELDFVTEGEETELDKTVVDRLGDPLLHLLRNGVDHGVERPEVRQESGKPRRGVIRLGAFHSGTNVVVQIGDDGKGLDSAAIRAKGVERGLVAPEAPLTQREIFSLILAPGFSTATEVTSVSGRGVGMDVVRRNIEALGGSIEMESTLGRGTTFTLRLPLTLAIIEGFLVKVSGAYFILPLSLVEECVELPETLRKTGLDRHYVNLRGEIVPFIFLRRHFQVPGGPPPVEVIVVTRVAGVRMGFVVDHVVGEHQTVVKPLGRFYRSVQDISGASILGDGSIALIVDVQNLLKTMKLTSE